MKKRIEPVASVQAELSVGDLVDISGGMPSGRYGGSVPGGRQSEPAPTYGHGRSERGDRPAQPVNGPNRPYQPSGDSALPPTRGDFRSTTTDNRGSYGWD